MVADADLAVEAPYLTKRATPVLVIVDDDTTIVAAEPRLQELFTQLHLDRESPERLPPAIEISVREAITGERLGGAFCVAGLVVRCSVLQGAGAPTYAVALERARERDPVKVASSRYRLTKRERQVLQLLLDGADAKAIARTMSIAESTVNEYFKHLYAKFGVNTRCKLVARVFDWSRDIP